MPIAPPCVSSFHDIRSPERGVLALAGAALLLSACFSTPDASLDTEGADGTSTSTSTSTSTQGSETDETPDPPGGSGQDPGSESTTGAPVEPDPDCVSPDAGVTIAQPAQPAQEGGEAITYTVALEYPPCSTVEITATGDTQLELDATVTFSAEDWDVPQEIDVAAVLDFEREGDHVGAVQYTVSSDDPAFDALAVPNTVIDVLDRAHLAHVSAPPQGGGANADSLRPRVSNDGRWVAFLTDASNLVFGDSGIHRDAYRRDMLMGPVERLTVGVDGEPNAATETVDMSADGSIVVLSSLATNLVAEPVVTREIYRWTADDGLVALTAPCAACDDETQPEVSISSDGEHVAYATRRQMLPSDTESEFDVFTVYLPTGALTHDSLNGDGQNGTTFWYANAFDPKLSSDGMVVTFASPAQNLDFPDIVVQNFHTYAKDRATGTLTRTSRHSGGLLNCDGIHHSSHSNTPHASTDGNIVAFSSLCAIGVAGSPPVDQSGRYDVFVRDIGAMTTTRISVGYDDTEADGHSNLLDISDDARYLLLRSDATNLVPDDTNGATDLFVHDRDEGTTTRVSYDHEYGQLVSGVDENAGLSPDGRWVVFATRDALLPSDDNDDVLDVYRVQLH